MRRQNTTRGVDSDIARILTALALALVIPLAALGQETPEADDGAVAADAAPAESPEPLVEAEDLAVDELEVDVPPEPVEPPAVERRTRIDRYDTSVQIFSSLIVEADEVYEEAVAIMGPLTIHGVVEGDAVAVGGPVEVSGVVEGELVSIGGPVHLTATAQVGRLVNVGGKLTREEGSVVEGAIEDHASSGFSINIEDGDVRIGTDDGEGVHVHEDRSDREYASVGFYEKTGEFFAAMIGNLVALALLIFMLAVAAVLAPRLIDRTRAKLATDPWKAAVAGVLTEIGFLPALIAGCIFLAISIVGILLLPAFIPLMFLALMAAALVGFAAVSQHVGEMVVKRFERNLPGRVPTIAIGAVALHFLWWIGFVLGLLPGALSMIGVLTVAVGVVISFIAWTTGLGALLLAAFDPPAAVEPTQAPPPLPVIDEDEPTVETSVGPEDSETGGGGEAE